MHVPTRTQSYVLRKDRTASTKCESHRQTKGRLASDDQAVRLPCERFDRFEKCVSVSRMKIPVQSFFTAVIDDTDVHLIGVQVDSAVEWMLFLIQIHWFSLWLSKY